MCYRNNDPTKRYVITFFSILILLTFSTKTFLIFRFESILKKSIAMEHLMLEGLELGNNLKPEKTQNIKELLAMTITGKICPSYNFIKISFYFLRIIMT